MPITARVTKLPVIELPSYRVTSHRVTKLPSNQSSITSHQEGNYQTDEPKHQKRREEDTCLIAVEHPELLVRYIYSYSLIRVDNVWFYILNDSLIWWTSSTVVTICTTQYIPFSSVYLIHCVWVYISGSQSLVVRSIPYAKDFHKIHTVYAVHRRRLWLLLSKIEN